MFVLGYAVPFYVLLLHIVRGEWHMYFFKVVA